MRRIVISGTYCTGKTTLSLALSTLSGIPATHAATMREILPQLFPSKDLRSCCYSELLCLGMRRFSERIATEAGLGGAFISDGCPLQEWIYGSTRLLTGAYPDESAAEFAQRHAHGALSLQAFGEQLSMFGQLAKNYTRSHYDLFFHLPVEFPFVADGHRPTSEAFRKQSEELLLQTYHEMSLTPIVLSGPPERRLATALECLGIEAKTGIAEAMQTAEAVRQQNFDRVRLERAGHPYPVPPPSL